METTNKIDTMNDKKIEIDSLMNEWKNKKIRHPIKIKFL